MAHANVRGAFVGLGLAILILAAPVQAAGPDFERTPDLRSRAWTWFASLWEETGAKGIFERVPEAPILEEEEPDGIDPGNPWDQGSGIDPDG